jgi:hypothetical protein
MRTAFALAILLVSAPAAAAQPGGIAPSRATYSARAELRGGGAQDLGTREITISDTTVGGTRAWLVVNAFEAEGMRGVDSVLMRAADLAPISRRAVIGSSKLSVDARDGMLVGTLKSPRGTVPISLRAGDRAFMNYYALRTALRAWPLAAGWRGTAGMMELNGRTELTPLELVVDGDERVRVAAGEFDCWRVHVTSPAGIDERYWVSKNGGHVVRTREPIGDAGAMMQLDLTALAPAP